MMAKVVRSGKSACKRSSDTGNNASKLRAVEVAFIDVNVADPGFLLSMLRPGIQGIVLNAAEPAPVQMARALQGRRNIASIHVIAHGEPGQINFAAGSLTTETIGNHAGSFARIGLALANGGGLSLWSCHTGLGDAGARFGGMLSKSTGAPTAASSNPVGGRGLGGSWLLDRRWGTSQVHSPLTPTGIVNYASIMSKVETHYLDAAISGFDGNFVSGNDASNSFTVTGTATYDSSSPHKGDSIALTLAFDNGSTQTFNATVTGLFGSGSTKSITWSMTDSNLAANSPALTPGSHTVWISSFAGITLQMPFTYNFDYVTCFVRGTHIATPAGDVAVEDLAVGDSILTVSAGAKPIKWIGYRQLNVKSYRRPEQAAPVRIRQGAVAENLPHRDLLVSPDHAIFLDGLLICARQLINTTTIRQELDCASVEYFHIELDAHAILLAEGLPAESYLDTGNRNFFANAREALVLRPNLAGEAAHPTRMTASCAPFASDEVTVHPVWQRLAERAAVLGQPVPIPDATVDPELHFVVNDQNLQPVYSERGRFVFVLPSGTTQGRLVSRAGPPTDIQPWLEDRRSLGIYVERILLRTSTDTKDIAVDDPSLAEGWWAVERQGSSIRRWTNGNALLPLGGVAGATMLEIHVSGDMRYVAKPKERDAA